MGLVEFEKSNGICFCQKFVSFVRNIIYAFIAFINTMVFKLKSFIKTYIGGFPETQKKCSCFYNSVARHYFPLPSKMFPIYLIHNGFPCITLVDYLINFIIILLMLFIQVTHKMVLMEPAHYS